MSINQLIETSRRSLRTYTAAMNTAGQNVANVNTEGYSRRRISLQADSITSSGITRPVGPHATGAGVSIQSYERMRDGLLASAGHDAQTGLGGAQEEQRLLGALEGIFPPGEGSLDAQLNNFWNAWADLADNPTDTGTRAALRTKASSVTSTLNRTSEALSLLEQGSSETLVAGVDEINDILGEISKLNRTIQTTRSSGSSDLTAEDRRDQLVKDLSAFGPVRLREDTQTGYTVMLDGMTVVEGTNVTELQLDTSGATPRVIYEDTQVEYSPPAGDDGKLGAMMRMVTQTLPDTRSALDEIASTLVTEVNTLHRAGFGLDGGTGRDFFDAGATSAGAISLSADVLGDVRTIATSSDATALGDSSVALDIAGLRTQSLLNGGTETIEAYAVNLVGDIGGKVQTASLKAVAQSAVLDHLTGMEQGVSGVSIDEEMTNLIQYQQAYAASARVLNTAQEMMDTLLSL